MHNILLTGTTGITRAGSVPHPRFSGKACSCRTLGKPGARQEPLLSDYFNQASTLALFASTHFWAAASGFIWSAVMYLATWF
jgi:hypothetical protein